MLSLSGRLTFLRHLPAPAHHERAQPPGALGRSQVPAQPRCITLATSPPGRGGRAVDGRSPPQLAASPPRRRSHARARTVSPRPATWHYRPPRSWRTPVRSGESLTIVGRHLTGVRHEELELVGHGPSIDRFRLIRASRLWQSSRQRRPPPRTCCSSRARAAAGPLGGEGHEPWWSGAGCRLGWDVELAQKHAAVGAVGREVGGEGSQRRRTARRPTWLAPPSGPSAFAPSLPGGAADNVVVAAARSRDEHVRVVVKVVGCQAWSSKR